MPPSTCASPFCNIKKKKKTLNLSVTKNNEKNEIIFKDQPVTKERWDQLSLNFFWHGWELLRTAWTGKIFPAAWINSILYLYSGKNDAKLCILPCCLSQESPQHRAPPAHLCASQRKVWHHLHQTRNSPKILSSSRTGKKTRKLFALNSENKAQPINC